MDLVTPFSGLIFWQLSGLVYIGFWAFALFDCVRNEFRGTNQKLNWMLLILLAPVIGTLLYLGMSDSTKEKSQLHTDLSSTQKNNE
jgi:hypothetical protein